MKPEKRSDGPMQTELPVRAELVERAAELDLDVTAVVERALEAAVREREAAELRAEDEAAIAHYNAFIAEHGLFGDDHRPQ